MERRKNVVIRPVIWRLNRPGAQIAAMILGLGVLAAGYELIQRWLS